MGYDQVPLSDPSTTTPTPNGVLPTTTPPTPIFVTSAPMVTGTLLYSSPSAYSWLTLLSIVILVAFELVLGIYFMFFSMLAGFVIFGSFALVVLIYLVLLPRRIDIYTDRVSVISLCGVPYSTPLCDIISATKHEGIWISYPCSTLKFATSFSDIIVIQRRNSWFQYVTFSPTDSSTFLSHLAAALRPGMYSIATPVTVAPSPFMFPNGAADYNAVASQGGAHNV